MSLGRAQSSGPALLAACYYSPRTSTFLAQELPFLCSLHSSLHLQSLRISKTHT